MEIVLVHVADNEVEPRFHAVLSVTKGVPDFGRVMDGCKQAFDVFMDVHSLLSVAR